MSEKEESVELELLMDRRSALRAMVSAGIVLTSASTVLGQPIESVVEPQRPARKGKRGSNAQRLRGPITGNNPIISVPVDWTPTSGDYVVSVKNDGNETTYFMVELYQGRISDGRFRVSAPFALDGIVGSTWQATSNLAPGKTGTVKFRTSRYTKFDYILIAVAYEVASSLSDAGSTHFHNP